MTTLQITIDIDDEAVQGHALNKLSSSLGDDAAEVIDRIARANAEQFPSYKLDSAEVTLQAIAAAVQAAEG